MAGVPLRKRDDETQIRPQPMTLGPPAIGADRAPAALTRGPHMVVRAGQGRGRGCVC